MSMPNGFRRRALALGALALGAPLSGRSLSGRSLSGRSLSGRSLSGRPPSGRSPRRHGASRAQRTAAAAGVKKLVLSHFVPGDVPSITGEMWLHGVRKHFSGDSVVGKDLMVL